MKVFLFFPKKSRGNYLLLVLRLRLPLVSKCPRPTDNSVCHSLTQCIVWALDWTFLSTASNCSSSAQETFHCVISYWQIFCALLSAGLSEASWLLLTENTIHEKNFLMRKTLGFSAEYQQNEKKHNYMRIRTLYVWFTSGSNQSKDSIRANPLML